MKLRFSALALALSLSCIVWSNALESNPQGDAQILSDSSDVCTASSGRTSTCEVELDVPSSCVDPNTSTSTCPVVFFFHGAGGTNNWFAGTSNVHDYDFVGVYPQGENGWNTGPKDTNACAWDDFACSDDPDEGDFVARIIAELRRLGALGNVYLIGNSNGAALSMRLAVNAGDELPIKGVVTKVTQLLASPERSGPGVLNHNQPLAGNPAVSILNIMGDADGLIPYDGGTSAVFGGDDNFVLMSALESMDDWAAHNGCALDPTITTGVAYSTNADPDGLATFYEYGGCPNGNIVEHFKLHGGGHSLGSGAAVNGKTIDYDLAFDFILRVEGMGGGGGGGPCEDDSTWRGKFNDDHDCSFVGLHSAGRCSWEDQSGALAKDACKVSCNTCDEPVTPTPPAPVTLAPVTPAPVSPVPTPPPVSGCTDDPDWHGKYNELHDCAFVALATAYRCGWVSSDGISAGEACKYTCGGC